MVEVTHRPPPLTSDNQYIFMNENVYLQKEEQQNGTFNESSHWIDHKMRQDLSWLISCSSSFLKGTKRRPFLLSLTNKQRSHDWNYLKCEHIVTLTSKVEKKTWWKQPLYHSYHFKIWPFYWHWQSFSSAPKIKSKYGLLFHKPVFLRSKCMNFTINWCNYS